MTHAHDQSSPADEQVSRSSSTAETNSAGYQADSQASGLSQRQQAVLTLQQTHGNNAVRQMLGKSPASTVQRDLAAYKREHLDVEPSMSPDAGPPVMDTATADASGLQAALQALVTANKISSRDDGEKIIFSNVSATRDEIVAALTTASYPRAAQMADALIEQHRLSIYSHEEVSMIPGIIWDTELSRTQQNLDVQTRRGLTGSERTEASKIYGSSLNYDAIVLEDSPVMAIGGYARTTPWTVNFPSGTLANNSLTIDWLLHELGHSWQYARGVSMIRTLYHAVRGVYDYGGEAALRAATAAGRGLNSFNTEQQADIAKDAYEAIGREC